MTLCCHFWKVKSFNDLCTFNAECHSGIMEYWKVLEKSTDKNKSSTLICLGKFIQLGKMTFLPPSVFLSHNTYGLGYKHKFGGFRQV